MSGIPNPDALWTVYVIYEHPRDFPNSCVCRVWRDGKPDQGLPWLIGPTVEDLRLLLPPSLTRFDRDPDDDPAIAEIWI